MTNCIFTCVVKTCYPSLCQTLFFSTWCCLQLYKLFMKAGIQYIIKSDSDGFVAVKIELETMLSLSQMIASVA